MSTTPATSKDAATRFMVVAIKGKIDARRRYENMNYVRIVTPAADAYSRPQVVEVRSKERIGEIGEEVTISAMLGGYTRKNFRVTDKETGETSIVTPVDMTLDHLVG